jgi:dihydrolipoamide dehydrogenase
MMNASAITRAVRPQVLRRNFAAAAEQADVIVLGGGPGGYVAAIKAGQLGMKVTCVEKRGTLGGTCLNVGCIPSKALLNASHMYHDAEHSFASKGINIEGLSLDWGKMQESKDKAVSGLTAGIEGLFKKNKVDYVKGHGRISGPNEITVDLMDGGTQTISAKNIIIASGSEPSSLPGIEIDEVDIVSSTGALKLPNVPKAMTVVGGGVIGLEMGSVYARLGTEVTVVEFLDRIVPTADLEMGKTFMRTLKKQGIKFKLSTAVQSVSKNADGKMVCAIKDVKKDKDSEIESDVVLISTGRRPNTDDIGLDSVGIATDKIGRVVVDDHFKTSSPSIFAIGDAIAGPMLAHKAEEEGIACVEMLATGFGHVNYDAIPGVIYTHPEMADCGKTEEHLKEAGIKYNVGKFPFAANSRARTNDDADGMVKILSCADTDRVLGIHIIGPNAGELIAEGVLGMEYGCSSEDIGRTCHAHPTLSEAFKEAAMAVYDKPIHF